MIELAEGRIIIIQCSIHPGAFSNERLITIKTDDSELSGFINLKHLNVISETTGTITGKVISVNPDSVTIQLPASFFTSAAGKTSVNSTWAQNNLQVAAG